MPPEGGNACTREILPPRRHRTMGEKQRFPDVRAVPDTTAGNKRPWFEPKRKTVRLRLYPWR
jgi:hypothetical protein